MDSVETVKDTIGQLKADSVEHVYIDSVSPEEGKTVINEKDETTDEEKRHSDGKDEEPNISHQQEPVGTLSLGYALWKGESSHGKPNGRGTLAFTAEYEIAPGKKASPGDRIDNCLYHEGRLVQGLWVRADGSEPEIIALGGQ